MNYAKELLTQLPKTDASLSALKDVSTKVAEYVEAEKPSQPTADDVQEALATMSMGCVAALYWICIMQMVAVTALVYVGVLAVEAWQKHNMTFKCRVFLTVAARAWVAGVSALCFEGAAVLTAVVEEGQGFRAGQLIDTYLMGV